MPKKPFALLLAACITATCGQPLAAAQAPADRKAQHQTRYTARIKAEVARRGTGDAAQVNVELYDKTRLSGHIAKIGAEEFVVHEAKTGRDTTVPYSKVKTLRHTGPGVLRTAALGAGAFQSKTVLIVVAVLFAVVIALVASDQS